MMALLDCFSRYHQIWLHTEDEENANFITPFGTYCYLRMTEGRRNAGPTFCRMTKVVLKDQVINNVLSYVDDIVVVSKKKEDYLSDLAETFANMREVKLKLNPEKCVFGITRGEGPRLSSINKGHRSKPRQDQGNHSDATSVEQKECTKAHMPDIIVEPIHIEAHRTQSAFLHHTRRLHQS
jgi:hypothetical protein